MSPNFTFIAEMMIAVRQVLPLGFGAAPQPAEPLMVSGQVPDAQARPQLPQLAGSWLGSMHWPRQQSPWPLWLAIAVPPKAQVSPSLIPVQLRAAQVRVPGRQASPAGHTTSRHEETEPPSAT